MPYKKRNVPGLGTYGKRFGESNGKLVRKRIDAARSGYRTGNLYIYIIGG